MGSCGEENHFCVAGWPATDSFLPRSHEHGSHQTQAEYKLIPIRDTFVISLWHTCALPLQTKSPGLIYYHPQHYMLFFSLSPIQLLLVKETPDASRYGRTYDSLPFLSCYNIGYILSQVVREIVLSLVLPLAKGTVPSLSIHKLGGREEMCKHY